MNEALQKEISIIAGGCVLFDEPLSRHTSIGVGGCAQAIAFPRNIQKLGELLSFLQREEIPRLAVGNWTNIIARDGGYRGVIVCLKHLRDKKIFFDPQGSPILWAEAGVLLSDLVTLSAKEGFSGLEFCAGIPGSVGGAIFMNAGAYGSEIKDLLEDITLFEPSGMTSTWQRNDLNFAYRRFELPVKGGVILAATFHLSLGDREIIQEKIKEIKNIRKQKHPLEYRSAGSIFKNPQNQPAGRIIDESGLKGLQLGGAQISEKHGNFIINRGGATAKDILDLIAVIQDKVFRERDIILETEVIVVGEDQ